MEDFKIYTVTKNGNFKFVNIKDCFFEFKGNKQKFGDILNLISNMETELDIAVKNIDNLLKENKSLQIELEKQQENIKYCLNAIE